MNPKQAIKWSFLSEIASKAVQPLVFVILARLLTPEDYGVVASATMVISFSQIFWEAGMGKAIIQYQGDRKATANVAFWVNIVLGIVVAGILISISAVVANRIFHDTRVAPVLQVMALQVFLSASASIHTALLQKDMNFKNLFWVRMATVAVPGLFSIPLAWYGMGYWALVAGSLAGQAMQVAMLWKMSPWKPEFSFDFTIARQLVRFGGWVALSGLLGWFYLWADSLIVGIYLGPRELGLYRVGNTFAGMIFGFMFAPLLPVLYSYFSKIQSDVETLRKTLFKVISIITFISIPIAFLIVINSSLIANTVFGQKWQGIGIVISILALTHGYSYVVGANGEAYRAVGKPSYETIITSISLPVYLTAYLLSVKHGLEIFLWVRFGLVIIALLFHLWLAKIVVYLSIKSSLSYMLKVSFICSVPLLLSYFLNLFSLYQSQIDVPLISTVLLGSLLFISERTGLVPYIFNFIARKKDYA